MERSSFFNAELKGEEYDRVYLAEDFARYFASFIGDGVFPNPTTNLQVVAVDSNMTAKITVGKAWINGYFYENTDNLVLNVDVADGVLNRIDRVVLRLDFINREIKAYVKKGEFASSPVAPLLQRDADMYELGIADIRINKGVTKITQANITDLRQNSSYCGLVSGVVQQIDTTNLFAQFQSTFDIWFEHIKGQLSEDAAGKIQLEIDEINSELLDKEKKMKFINVPENSDLAEYFKTVDTIGTYRVAPGNGVTNVCTDLSSIYTFYYVYQTFVLGVTEGGRVFKAGFVNKTLGAWEEILTNKKTSFKLTPKAGFTIAYQNCYAINNIVYINARFQMTDGSLFQPTSGNRELATSPTKYCPTDATALQSWAASASTIGIPGASSAAAVSDGRILVVNTGTPKTITISGVYFI